MDFNLESLRVGQSIGCLVNKEGELRYFVDGKDQGVGWTGLPTDKPLWGFADIYGLARKIKSEFLCGEFAECSYPVLCHVPSIVSFRTTRLVSFPGHKAI